ncbi:hypothetical protein C0J52_05975 [Blattella germanica]|nr:hypothetical protein C0J52_05975 [Blattella germanica]
MTRSSDAIDSSRHVPVNFGISSNESEHVSCRQFTQYRFIGLISLFEAVSVTNKISLRQQSSQITYSPEAEVICGRLARVNATNAAVPFFTLERLLWFLKGNSREIQSGKKSVEYFKKCPVNMGWSGKKSVEYFKKCPVNMGWEMILQFVQLLNAIPPSPLMLLRSKLLLSYISPEEVCPTVSVKIPLLPFPLYSTKSSVINFTSLLRNSKRPRIVCFSIWDIHENKCIPIFNIIDYDFTSSSLRQAPANPIIITTFVNKYFHQVLSAIRNYVLIKRKRPLNFAGGYWCILKQVDVIWGNAIWSVVYFSAKYLANTLGLLRGRENYGRSSFKNGMRPSENRTMNPPLTEKPRRARARGWGDCTSVVDDCGKMKQVSCSASPLPPSPRCSKSSIHKHVPFTKKQTHSSL